MARCAYRCTDSLGRPRQARKGEEICDRCADNLCRRSKDPLPLIEKYADTLRVRAARTAEVLHPTRGGYLSRVIQRRKARERDERTRARRREQPRQRRATHQAPAHEPATA